MLGFIHSFLSLRALGARLYIMACKFVVVIQNDRDFRREHAQSCDPDHHVLASTVHVDIFWSIDAPRGDPRCTHAQNNTPRSPRQRPQSFAPSSPASCSCHSFCPSLCSLQKSPFGAHNVNRQRIIGRIPCLAGRSASKGQELTVEGEGLSKLYHVSYLEGNFPTVKFKTGHLVLLRSKYYPVCNWELTSSGLRFKSSRPR
jgi:hypothetical protein